MSGRDRANERSESDTIDQRGRGRAGGVCEVEVEVANGGEGEGEEQVRHVKGSVELAAQ